MILSIEIRNSEIGGEKCKHQILCISWLIKEYVEMDGTHNLKIEYRRLGLRTSLQRAFTVTVSLCSIHVYLQSQR